MADLRLGQTRIVYRHGHVAAMVTRTTEGYRCYRLPAADRIVPAGPFRTEKEAMDAA